MCANLNLKIPKIKKKKIENKLRDQLGDTFINYPHTNFIPLDLHKNDSITEIYLHDHTLSYVFVKSKKLKLIGKSEKEVIGLNPKNVIPVEQYLVLEKIYSTCKITREHSQNTFFWLGKVQILDTFPLVDKKNNFIGIFIVQREKEQHELVV